MNRKRLTPIELVAGIAVLGIFVIMLYPIVGHLLEKESMEVPIPSVRQIAQSYAAFTVGGRGIVTQHMRPGGGRSEGVAVNIDDVAFILAQQAELNDGQLWFITADDALNNAKIPQNVILGNVKKATDVAPDFKNTNPKSWAFVVGVSSDASPSRTSLLWTYGLGMDGKWSSNSPWKGTGGHIAFLDGHIVWATAITLDPGPGEMSLTSFKTSINAGKPTVNYQEAIESHGGQPWVIVNADGKGN